MIRNYSEEEKISYVEAYKQSGVSINQFAEENNIPSSTLRGWLDKEQEFGFGELSLKPRQQDIPKAVKKTSVFANETVRIELKEGFDRDFVLKMVEVMTLC